MERDMPSGPGQGIIARSGVADHAQRIPSFGQTLRQARGLDGDLLGTVLADAAHAGVDRGQDLTHVTGLGGGQQPHRPAPATGDGLGLGDTVEHPMHAIGDLIRAPALDDLVRQVLMLHVCRHCCSPR